MYGVTRTSDSWSGCIWDMFVLHIDDAKVYLEALVRYHTGLPWRQPVPYSLSLNEALAMGDKELRDMHATILAGFVAELGAVTQVSTPTMVAIPPLSANFTKNPQLSAIVGWRAELTVASMLKAADIEFSWSDGPDFRIGIPADGVEVEVVSMTWIDLAGQGTSHQDAETVLKRLGRSIRRKHKKSYANRQAVLFVDATAAMSVMARVHKHQSGEVSLNRFNQTIASAIGHPCYGAVVVHSYVLEHSQRIVDPEEEQLAASLDGVVIELQSGDASVHQFGARLMHRLRHMTSVFYAGNSPPAVRLVVEKAFRPPSSQGDGTFRVSGMPFANLYM